MTSQKQFAAPFTDTYTQEEINFYGLENYAGSYDNVIIRTRDLIGRCDELFNVSFHTGDITFPSLWASGQLWMSLTPLEIQSHWIPITKSKGKCATGGLGMGYYTLRAMAKDEVESVDVYERDGRIVKMFCDNFSERKGFGKLNFIMGDVRETMMDKEYDFVFMDIYPTQLTDEVLSDIPLFTSRNTIHEYHPWMVEVVWQQYYHRQLGEDIPDGMAHLLVLHSMSEGHNLRSPFEILSDDYIREFADAMHLISREVV